MILHLFHDDKVCNCAIANFEEVYPNENIYICICDKDNLKYVHDDKKVIFLNSGEPLHDPSILANIETIIIHYLDIPKIEFIEKYFPLKNVNIKIFWSLWGGDIYNEVLYSMGYNIYYKKCYVHSLKSKIVDFIKRIFKRNSLMSNINKTISFIDSRIDYIMSFRAEYELFCKYWKSGHFKPKSIPNLPIYYPIEDILGNMCGKRVNGRNIFVGNSASFTNNHIYAYRYLSKVDLQGSKIISPMSYGGSYKYRKYVKSIGCRYWGGDYYPLDHFMPLNDYNELMLSASVYVYGTWRQEAIGNIVMALYLGAKVYVSEKSPLFSIFRDFDIELYKTEEISSDDFFESEDEEKIRQNQQNIFKVYSKAAILNHIKEIFG